MCTNNAFERLFKQENQNFFSPHLTPFNEVELVIYCTHCISFLEVKIFGVNKFLYLNK